MPKSELLAVLSDFHCPYQSEEAVSVALSILSDIQPDIVILGGDIIDFAPLSRFTKSPYDVLTLQEDLNKTKTLLLKLRAAAPDATFIFLSGNHEDRLHKYLSVTPALYPLDCLKIENLLDLQTINCTYLPDGKPYQWHGWNIVHGDVVRANAGATAQAMITKYGSSGWNGHTHRLGVVHKRNHSNSYTWTEGGCLCKLDPDYLSVADWCNGMTVLSAVNTTVWADVIPIKDGMAHYQGSFYGHQTITFDTQY